MKIQIIKLEPYDDVTSAKDKISWAKAARILLIWPGRTSVLTRRLDLVILNRYCQKMGVQLGLVTQLLPVVENAQTLGIPVFKSVKQAQKSFWRRTRGLPRFKRRPRLIRDYRAGRPAVDLENWQILQKPWLRLLAFTSGVSAVIILILALLPEAKVQLTPAHRLQETVLEVQASTNTVTIDYAGKVPARPISLVAEVEEKMAVSGSTAIPDKPAEGKVTFTNLSDRSITIPAGTVVRTLADPATRFVTTRETQIRGGGSAKAEVPVRAVEAGKKGDVPARTIKAIEGNLGASLSVINESAMKGGTDIQVPAASEADYKALETKAIDALSQQAIEQIKLQLAPADQWLEGSLILKKVLSKNWDPAAGEPTDEIRLTLRAEFEGYFAAAEDLSRLAWASLDAALPKGYLALGDTLTLSPLHAPEFKDGEASWYLVAKRDSRAELDESKALALTTGRSPQEAAQLLSSAYALEKTPAISIFPSGWPYMPILPFRISVKLEK